MIEGIDVIGEVVASEAIDCGWTKGGALRIATSHAQLERIRAGVEGRRRRGLGDADVQLLTAAEVADRVRISGVVGGTYTPHCARVHPGRLVRGLADACDRRPAPSVHPRAADRGRPDRGRRAWRPLPAGSAIRPSDERLPSVHDELERTLRTWFPAAAGAAITHRWGGVFAVPRDWSMSVTFDRAAGFARAGGLAGHGLVASSLCGRTLADLILERDSDLTSLPWVGHDSGRWEIEPARVVAQRLITAVLASADRVEDAGRGPARRTRLVARFTPSR
jgi:glycine/D-amino acid oxidase-like deaminating enzyme